MSRLMLRSGGASVPTSYERDEKPPHQCGRCRNPFTSDNPHCPNAAKEGQR